MPRNGTLYRALAIGVVLTGVASVLAESLGQRWLWIVAVVFVMPTLATGYWIVFGGYRGD